MKRNADNLSSEYSSQAQKAYLDTLADSLALPNKPRNSLKVEDVVRRNEVCFISCTVSLGNILHCICDFIL